MSAPRFTSDFDELLSAYVDGELTPDERAAVEERLRTDERARQRVDDLRTMADAVRSLPRVVLGRDLRGAIWAEVDRRQATAPSSRTVALPPRDPAPRSSRTRTMLYAAMAVAAAVMLMVLRVEDKPQGRDLARVAESKGGVEAGHGPAALDDSARRGGIERTEAGKAAGADGSDVGNVPQAKRARQIENRSAGASQVADRTVAPAAPVPRPLVSADAESPTGDADEAAAPPLFTVNVTVAADNAAAEFDRILNEHGIVLDEEGGETPRDVARWLSLAREEVDALAAASPPRAAVLVEASPAQIALVIAALREDAKAFAGVDAWDDADAGAAVAAEDESVTVAAAAPTSGRAWSLMLPDQAGASVDQLLLRSAASRESPAPTVGGGFGGGGRGSTSERLRVLFVLSPAVE